MIVEVHLKKEWYLMEDLVLLTDSSERVVRKILREQKIPYTIVRNKFKVHKLNLPKLINLTALHKLSKSELINLLANE